MFDWDRGGEGFGWPADAQCPRSDFSCAPSAAGLWCNTTGGFWMRIMICAAPSVSTMSIPCVDAEGESLLPVG